MVSPIDQAEPALAPGDGAASVAPTATPTIPPLNVTALVVTKADLVNALRIYVPQVVDIVPLDNKRFLLSLIPATSEEDR